MSHFTVIVVGENPERQLAPYHEFECTGNDDEYVQDVEETAALRKEYEEAKVCRFRDHAGKQYNPYDDRFFRDPTPEEQQAINKDPLCVGQAATIFTHTKDWGSRHKLSTRVHFLPEGFEEVSLSATEAMTFAEFIASEHGRPILPEHATLDLAGPHKWGYTVVDARGEVVRSVRRTNPNAKWDWYVLGGRWAGFWRLKSGDCADQAYVEDIDFVAMRREAEEKAAEVFDYYAECFAGQDIPLWADYYTENHDREAARAAYRAHPVIAALRAKSALRKDHRMLMLDAPRDYFCNGDRAAVLSRARRNAGRPSALLRDGVWLARGEMGWFGCVSDEEDWRDWSEEFETVMDSLPEGTLLSLYDCHI